MKTLRDFLISEAKDEERQPPEGYEPASVKGGITKVGLQILQQLSGVADDGSEVSYGDIMRRIQDPQDIKENFGVASLDGLNELLGTKGIFGSSEGAKRMQEIFLESVPAAKFIRGEGGYRVKLRDGWTTLAKTEKSSQKVIMFWVNTLYNVYKGESAKSQNEKLLYFFSSDKKFVIIDEK